MPEEFVHLHTHSEFSLLDGASRIRDLLHKAKEKKMPAIALTDHGAMYGIIDFYFSADEIGIKPIIGCEVYVAPRTRFDKEPRIDDNLFHLVLLAENNEGYKNLMKIVTRSYFDGFYYKPRVDHDLLKEYNNGLIALSGCLSGEIATLVLQDKMEKAVSKTVDYLNIFGESNFFLEIQNQNLKEQEKLNLGLEEIAKQLSIPLVSTNDIHYTNREDSTAHDVLLCIQTGSTIEEDDRLKFSTDQFYLKSFEEMKEALPDYKEAILLTSKIAERCNVEISAGKVLLPKYEPPEGYDLDSYLTKLCQEGLKKKYPEITKEIEERLQHELEVIKNTGFSGYFLIVWDFVRFAKSNGIYVGPGRGSVAGSIVSFCLNITDIDPLEHGLLFERFLNPERLAMPDIDIDFCYERRDEVIEYVAEKYGRDRVAQIITFGTMAARAATRDAGRVFNIPYSQVDKIAKLIPEVPGMTINKALNDNPEFKGVYENDEVAKKIVDAARTLEGLSRQDSIHAAGVVISDDELPKYTPLQRKGEAEIVTQYSMNSIAKLGLLKMDFLGLRTLTVLNKAIKIVKRIHGTDIDLANLSIDDKKTLDLLKQGETIGVFQLESSGMRAILRDMKPNIFSDLVAILALYRPGPIGQGIISDFIKAKKGLQVIKYSYPILKPILKETYGKMIYQEQVMQIAQKMAGYTMGEADDFRKAMGKKKPEIMKKHKEKFINGSVENGVPEKIALKIFDDIEYFAGYGFNKSHSAAYAKISYQTAYLKAHYPVEYMAALLTSIMNDKDKVAMYVNECRHLGIEVLLPDINESYQNFTVVAGKIRFGLSAIRNVGEGLIKAIIDSRMNEGAFKSLYDFCQRVDRSVMNKRAIESLIKGGAFDNLSSSRKYMLGTYERYMEAGIIRQRDKANGQITFFDMSEGEEETFGLSINEPDETEEMDSDQLLLYEKEMLGLYVSDHPLWGKEEIIKKYSDKPINELKEIPEGKSVVIAGLIGAITKITTKKGDIMIFFKLEDLVSNVEVIAFSKIYQKYSEILQEDKLVQVKGRVSYKDDELKIIASEISLLNEAKEENTIRTGPDPLYISMKSEFFDRQLAEELRDVLKMHPGKTPVFLKLREENKTTTLELGKDFKVKMESGLFAELKALLGEDSIQLN